MNFKVCFHSCKCRWQFYKKMMRRAENDTAEDAVYKWFMQKCSQGQPISGLVLCEKVLIFSEKLGGDPQFKASNAWLRNFKAGHGIQDLKIHRERISANAESADDFVFKFKMKTAEVNYSDDFMYTADETGVSWKALLQKTPSSRWETNTPGHEMSKDCVAVLKCAIASGNYKLPLIMIGIKKISKI